MKGPQSALEESLGNPGGVLVASLGCLLGILDGSLESPEVSLVHPRGSLLLFFGRPLGVIGASLGRSLSVHGASLGHP